MNRTVLIGLDGASFSILDPLMEAGVMPFLKRFADGGVRAGLLSTPNPLTPPAWASVMTGRSPGQHGLFDFIWAEQRETDHYFTLCNFHDIRCETIWSIVSREQGTIAALNFPFLSPPPRVCGSIVPGFVSWKHLGRNVYPRELYAELQSIPGFDAKSLAWDFDLEKKAEQGVSPEEYESWVAFHVRRERQWFEVARHLMRTSASDLFAILFDGPDKLLHMGYRFLDPAQFPPSPSAWERKVRSICLDYFRELDGFLCELVRLAGPEARVVMVSDHGFGPSWQVFRVNTWLHQEGYLVWKDLSGLDPQSRRSAQRVADRHFVLLDWDKTTAYARSATANGIFIRVAERPGEPGVPAGQYQAFRAELVAKLRALRAPDSGEPIVRDVLLKEEAFPGPHNRQAPDLTLVLCDHGFVSIKNKSPVIERRAEIAGTHYPEGSAGRRGCRNFPFWTLPPPCSTAWAFRSRPISSDRCPAGSSRRLMLRVILAAAGRRRSARTSPPRTARCRAPLPPRRPRC
jgi:predicted AlkP superfamily phosphohydrolase/phosphomutase